MYNNEKDIEGKQIRPLAERAAGWCKAEKKAKYTSSLSCRPKGDGRVDSDGLPRYRERLLLDGHEWVLNQKEWYRGENFVSFMQNF